MASRRTKHNFLSVFCIDSENKDKKKNEKHKIINHKKHEDKWVLVVDCRSSTFAMRNGQIKA